MSVIIPEAFGAIAMTLDLMTNAERKTLKKVLKMGALPGPKIQWVGHTTIILKLNESEDCFILGEHHTNGRGTILECVRARSISVFDMGQCSTASPPST